MDYFSDDFQMPATNSGVAETNNQQPPPPQSPAAQQQNFSYDYNTTGATNTTDPSMSAAGPVNPVDPKAEKDPYAVPEGCCKKTFSWNFYRQFCDMNTKEVGHRMLQAVAFWKGSFLEDAAMKKPDLWGSFWISTMLVFCLYFLRSVAIAINNAINDGDPTKYIHFDWTNFGIYAGCIYGYIIVVPLIIFLICWCTHYDLSFPVVSCLFGYAMVDLLPTCIFICVDAFIPDSSALIASAIVYTICLAWSTLFIIINLVKYLKHLEVNKAMFSAVIVVSLVCHIGIFITVGYFYITKNFDDGKK